MPAWTPGPWFMEPHADTVNVSAAGRVGRVEIAAVEIGFFSDEVNAEQSANAQLIATAPELYDALADLLIDVENEIEQRQTSGNDEYWQPLEAKAKAARAAIAKAHGAAP